MSETKITVEELARALFGKDHDEEQRNQDEDDEWPRWDFLPRWDIPSVRLSYRASARALFARVKRNRRS